MKTNGRKITCDLCGAEIFVKTTGERELDGGYTRYNLFEAAEGWNNTLEFGDICPECSIEYEKVQQEFKERMVPK